MQQPSATCLLPPLLLLLLLLLLQLPAATLQSDPIEPVVIDEGQGTAVVGELPDEDGFNYLVMASQEMKLGSNYTIGIAVKEGSLKSVTAALSTKSRADEFSDLATAVTKSSSAEGGQWTELTMRVDYEADRYDLQGKYELAVTITDFRDRKFTNSTEIRLVKPSGRILIQTDKAVYQPGQTVKYRVVTVDDAFRPVLVDTEVTIRDARRNLVYKQSYAVEDDVPQTADRTVSEGELPLSELPNEGSWYVEAVNSYGRRSKSFEVTRYALPKFSLEVTEPEFVHFNDSEFNVTARVRYTYDKPVQGTFKVKLGPYNPCRGCKPRYDMQQELEVEADGKGETQFSFDMEAWRRSLRSKERWQPNAYSYQAKASVVFVEKFTGVNKSASVGFSIYSQKYSVKISSQAAFFLPGFRVPLSVKLQRPDNKPFTGNTNETVTVTMRYRRRGKPESEEVYSGAVTPAADGTGVTVMPVIPASADFSAVEFEASLDDSNSQSNTRIVPYMAVSDEYVTADFVSEEGKLQMQLKKSNGIELLYMAVISNRQLKSWTQVSMEKNEATMDWEDSSCSDCEQLLPSATVMAVGVTAEGEIVAAAAEQDLSRFLPNVTLSSNLPNNTGYPRDNAVIEVQASPDSFVFLTGIDRSVNLIRTGQDILRSELLGGLPVAFGGWRPRPKLVDAAKLLREKNMVLLSDGFYFDARESNDYIMYGSRGVAMAAAAAPDSRRRMKSSDSTEDAGSDDRRSPFGVRDFFPETMVWAMIKTDSSGRGQQSVQLPDTITSWDVSAFAVRAGAPLQTMSAPAQLVTLKKFFLQPLLPARVVRGEIFLLKVLAFNYALPRQPPQATGANEIITTLVPEAANVSLLLNDSAFSASVVGGGRSWRRDGEIGVELPPSLGAGVVGVATFELRPKLPTDVTLQLRGGTWLRRIGSTSRYSDAVTKSLTVVPEGETVRRTKAMLLSLGGNGSAPIDASVDVEWPTEAAGDASRLVEGSEALKVSLLGDVFGPAMRNLRRLVRTPSGCGEQNLASFAPAVCVAKYLTAANRRSEPTMLAARRAMETGLQRQLTYRRRDGAYSAFGDGDAAGSAWLTGYVLGTFARAAEFVAVEASALTGDSLQFLLRQQSVNGDFAEPPGARVFDQRLQGGAADSSLAMSASVCASLLDVARVVRSRPELLTTEAKEQRQPEAAVAKCLRLLAAQPAAKLPRLGVLDLALSVYVLQFAEASGFGDGVDGLASKRAELRRELRSRCVQLPDGGKFWQTTSSWGWKRNSVEATAYALMDSVLADARPDLGVLRWLVDQQSDTGGFGTTQATVVGIRALTEFAEKANLDASVGVDASVAVAAGDGGDLRRQFEVDEDSRWLLQTQPLARGASAKLPTVNASASGSGLLLLTVAWQYNLRPKPRRQLGAEWLLRRGLGLRLGEKRPEPDEVGGVAVAVCATANLTDGMYILVVANPSGFAVSGYSRPEPAIPGLKRVETDQHRIVFYFDFLSAPVCVEARWRRSVPVLQPQPVQVTLRKYYSTEDSLTVFYSPPELNGITRCAACPDCPGCEATPVERLMKWLV